MFINKHYRVYSIWYIVKMRVGIAGDKRKEKIKNGSQESGVRSQNKEKIKNVARCKQRKKKKEEFNIFRKEGVRKE